MCSINNCLCNRRGRCNYLNCCKSNCHNCNNADGCQFQTNIKVINNYYKAPKIIDGGVF